MNVIFIHDYQPKLQQNLPKYLVTVVYSYKNAFFRKELHMIQFSQTYKTTLSTSPPSSTQVTN